MCFLKISCSPDLTTYSESMDPEFSRNCITNQIGYVKPIATDTGLNQPL